MAFADLMLGALSLPLYIYRVGKSFQLWDGGWAMPMSFFYVIADTFFSQASLISAAFVSGERFYAIYWPLKHRTLSMRAYSIIIFTVWVLTLLITALWGKSYKFLSFIQRCCICLDAIHLDSDIHHMWLQRRHLEKVQARKYRFTTAKEGVT